MTREEQETVFRFDANRAEVRIWTADKVVLRKLAKRGVTPYRSSTTEGVESGWWVRVPYKAFRWSIKAGGVGNPSPGSTSPAKPPRSPGFERLQDRFRPRPASPEGA